MLFLGVIVFATIILGMILNTTFLAVSYTHLELKKLGVFFEDAENFVGAGDLGIRQPHSTEFPAQLRHAAE